MSSLAPWLDAQNRLNAANLGVPIQWENTDFTPPQSAPWLAVQMVSNVLMPLDLGADVWVEIGSLFVHVFVPVGTGTEVARTLAKNVCNVFRGITSPNLVVYEQASIGMGERTDPPDGDWFRFTTEVQWKYTDQTT